MPARTEFRLSNARTVVFAIILLVLAGCPAEHRLYIHNKSDQTLSSAYPTDAWDVVTMRPGKTKYIWIGIGMESCFQLSVDGSVRAYHLPREVLAESKGTRYGGRLDVYFEYGKIHFRFADLRWAQIEEIDECVGT